ncbi:tRNA uracil 4-sulfurtransferase ThiI [Texcoconibacillus texcoconensis]|uniref:Probable tRNA sulfurtransferase n=1 Tax=Texcoconibacillus texcoconensis TaxID=1095777 RepID=A0A840QN18_9BACI|nr:tRNA uracil 4-sulfurtransferase ThiI [Texcoconibacillus texcoconensis]MBB5172757.1 thiamine biosynthesis protein ThiI [Texcoconibacillus texcoconensis]
MEYNHLLIRYAELALKGKNRKDFELQLQRNIRHMLRDFPNAKVNRTHGRMFITLNGEDPEAISNKLRNVFGIQSFSFALKSASNEEDICETALAALRKSLPNEVGTFKVSARRAFKQFPKDSQTLNKDIGAYLLRNTESITVDVHNPDVELVVEVRKDATYIMCGEEKGAGGLPVGSGGKVMLMLSGGIDSPVAGYLAMKRGVEIEAVHFHSPPFTNERARQKVEDLTSILTEYGGPIRLHIVPFTEAQKTIHEKVPDHYEMTIMRRMMMRITERLAGEKEALAIANGESLGQVASQTLESMHTITEVTTLPVLRPLVTMDKNEVIDIAQKINTYDISILPYEDCCTIFLPPQTKTKPKRDRAAAFEESLDIEKMVEEAVQGVETKEIDGTLESDASVEDLF